MPTWKKNIFVRVVARRMAHESRTAQDIVAEYPALAENEATEILAAVMTQ